MSSVEPTVTPGERVVMRTGLHPMAFAGALGIALFIGLWAMLLIRHNDLPLRTNVEIAVGGALLAALSAVPSWLRWRNTSVVVTDRRVLATAGARGQHRLELPLADVTVHTEPGLTGRLLDHATLSLTARDGRSWSIGHVASAGAVADAARTGGTKRRPSGGVDGRGERTGRE
jgi:hypothetical protein